MSQPDLLKSLVEKLDGAGIDYMITGSVASSLQGEPRLTHDIDVVIEITRDRIPVILDSFPAPRYYVEEAAILEAIETGGMFNVIDVVEGDKIDFWLLTREPFDRSRFARKCEEEVLGIRLKVSRPEDTILVKLRWSGLSGGSEKYFIDALRVFEVQGGHLDLDYLKEWSSALGLEDLYQRMLAEATPL
jgi:hypothetical protein